LIFGDFVCRVNNVFHMMPVMFCSGDYG